VTKDSELKSCLERLAEEPRIVICDSQAFATTAEAVPEEVPLTSFSILFARYKGELSMLAAGARHLNQLQPGDRVLISEACTHHPIENDIARVKIPRWLTTRVCPDLDFAWTAGSDFAPRPEEYDLIIHCGGCMINRREMLFRLEQCRSAGVPVTNYGMVIASVHGLLERALAPLEGKPPTNDE